MILIPSLPPLSFFSLLHILYILLGRLFGWKGIHWKLFFGILFLLAPVPFSCTAANGGLGFKLQGGKKGAF